MNDSSSNGEHHHQHHGSQQFSMETGGGPPATSTTTATTPMMLMPGNITMEQLVLERCRKMYFDYLGWKYNGTRLNTSCSQLQRTINGPLSAATIFSGMMANIWCLIVFIRPRTPPRIYHYLIALGLWDNALLLSGFLLHCLPTIYYGCLIPYGPYSYFYPFWYTMGNITLVGCVWIVLALAFDRTFALYRPILHKSVQSRARTRVLIIGISCAAICFGLPRFFEVAIRHCPESNLPYMSITTFRQNKLYNKLYKVVGGLVLYSLAPFIVLLFLTVMLFLHLRKARIHLQSLSASYVKKPVTSNHRRSTASNGRILVEKGANSVTGGTATTTNGTSLSSAPMSKKRVTTGGSRSRGGSALLAVIAAKFLLSRALPMILDLIESIVGIQSLQNWKFVIPSVTVSNYLVIFNSATNLFVYLICGSQFRRQSLIIVWSTLCFFRSGPPFGRKNSMIPFDFSENTTTNLTLNIPSPCSGSPIIMKTGSRSSLPLAENSGGGSNPNLTNSFVYIKPTNSNNNNNNISNSSSNVTTKISQRKYSENHVTTKKVLTFADVGDVPL